MRIGVILRLVPDLGDEIEFTADGTALDMEWIDLKPNEWDEQALEEAILIAEATGAEVVAMALGLDGADRLLKGAVARGARRSVKIACAAEGPLDSASAAPLYAAAARDLGVDLLLVGVQAPDDATGPLTGRLAALLDWPSAGAIAGATMETAHVEARQEYAGGRAAALALFLPAILGIQSASAPLRYVSGSRMGEAMRATLEVLTLSDALADPGFRPISLAPRAAQRHAEMLEGSPTATAVQMKEILSARGLWPE